jgi:serine phosphatase RsbU (regulator of sigma subunit)
MPIAHEESSDSEHVMQCMEVWGGNVPVDNTVTMLGLDAWVYSRPYMEADGGGDVYYASSCATGRIVRLLLADVSGHGSAVCDIAGTLRSLMRANVNRISQRTFVREMNRQFAALSDGGCFATAIVNTFFAPTNTLTLCNAGHPAPLLFRASSGRWRLLRNADDSDRGQTGVWNLPLGIEDIGDYSQFGVKLEMGDLVICYSDSLIESRGVDGEMLGEAGLLDIVQLAAMKSPETFIPALLARLGELHPDNLKNDDVTILMFRARGKGQKPSFLRGLAGPFRFLAAAVRAVRDREPIPMPEFNLTNVGGSLFGPLNRPVK